MKRNYSPLDDAIMRDGLADHWAKGYAGKSEQVNEREN
jgi:hypothetical protein